MNFIDLYPLHQDQIDKITSIKPNEWSKGFRQGLSSQLASINSNVNKDSTLYFKGYLEGVRYARYFVDKAKELEDESDKKLSLLAKKNSSSIIVGAVINAADDNGSYHSVDKTSIVKRFLFICNKINYDYCNLTNEQRENLEKEKNKLLNMSKYLNSIVHQVRVQREKNEKI